MSQDLVINGVTYNGVESISVTTKDGQVVQYHLTSGIELPELLNEGNASDLMKGKQLINGEGEAVTGTFSLDSEMTAQDSLIAQIKLALAGKAAGEGGGDDMAGALADRTITEFSSNNCTTIAGYSFRGCASLQTLVAPNAKSVGEYALYQCSKLKSIVLPSVTTVATNAFREATNLEVVDLPKLTAIPGTAFYGCRGLKALILRSETMVTLSGTNAFTQCYCLLGTKNSGYNPTGEKIGFIYVPTALFEQYAADSVWVSTGILFRAIEDYPDVCG